MDYVWPIIYFILDWWWLAPIFVLWAFISLLAIGGAFSLGDE